MVDFYQLPYSARASEDRDVLYVDDPIQDSSCSGIAIDFESLEPLSAPSEEWNKALTSTPCLSSSPFVDFDSLPNHNDSSHSNVAIDFESLKPTSRSLNEKSNISTPGFRTLMSKRKLYFDEEHFCKFLSSLR